MMNRPLSGGIAATLLALILAGCASRSPTIRPVQNGEPLAIAPTLQAVAMADMSSAVATGLSAYGVVPGDTIEVTYNISDSIAGQPYRLAVGDQLDIDFRTQPEYNRHVVVRPDGEISLPAIGDVPALGTTPAGLSHRIAAAYADMLVDPLVTVIVQSFHTPTDDLKELLQNGTAQRAKTVMVEPDGTVNLPLLPPVRVAGRTVGNIESSLDAAYRAHAANIETSVRVAALAPSNLFVFGEVQHPGPITAGGPRTLVQLIAAAGGTLPTAATDQVRVVSIDPMRGPLVRIVDLDRLTRGWSASGDFAVPPGTTVYVPPSRLARIAGLVDLIMRRVLLFNGVNLGLNYGLDPSAQ